MKIILVDVASVDGKLTKGNSANIHDWTSKEDLAYFEKVKSENNLLVMGSGTFEKAEIKPEKERLRIVLTSNPEKYMQYEIKDQLEFSNETPQELIKHLEKRGYKQMLLVSGGKLATSFFSLVNGASSSAPKSGMLINSFCTAIAGPIKSNRPCIALFNVISNVSNRLISLVPS